MTYKKDIDTDHLAHLCRIKLTDQEKDNLAISLDKILNYMDLLDEVPTEGVLPCLTVLETIQNVMGEDTEGELLSRDTFLKNAPDEVGGMLKVPPVIQFEE